MKKILNLFIKIFNYFYNMEIIRFLISGGINTLIGGIFLPFLFTLVIPQNNQILKDWLPLVLGYLIWFPFAYVIQVKMVFKTEYDLKRFVIYPTTQIPNYFIQLGIKLLVNDLIIIENQAIHSLVTLAISAIIATPIMFVLVRLVVKKPKKE